MTDNHCPQCGADRWTVDENAPYCENSWHREQDQRSPLQSVITWIPVSERLPDVERLVLLGNYGDDTSRYGWKSRIPGFWSLGADFRPLHAFSLWAELPTLPAGAEGEG